MSRRTPEARAGLVLRSRRPSDRLVDPSRRAFLRQGFTGMGLLIAGPAIHACGSEDDSPPMEFEPIPEPPATSQIGSLGSLGEPDENGLRLPEGFTSRVVARSGQPVEGTDYAWHPAPDGGATFPMPDGGWVYVSNNEHFLAGMGGVSAVRFDRDGNIVDAYSLLEGTQRNCAGGPTPWGTWLSCEEHAAGQVWECDPAGNEAAVPFPALGVFKHEAVAVDPATNVLYLTEDEEDGRFYRFTPDGMDGDRPNLASGTLEVARVMGDGPEGSIEWLPVPDAMAESSPTRKQVPESTAFDGGEGIWFHEGVVYFTTKGDNRVWAYDVADSMLAVIYDDDDYDTPVLTGVDNVVVSAGGDVLVAEDGGDMQIVALTPAGDVLPLVQVVGQDGSEITGPAFSPDRQRLYFSSQRGESGDLLGTDGITYEIRGPFFV